MAVLALDAIPRAPRQRAASGRHVHAIPRRPSAARHHRRQQQLAKDVACWCAAVARLDPAFVDGSQAGVAFATGRLADSASVLRDMIVDAWRASADMSVGYPPISVRDIRRHVLATTSAATEPSL